MRNYEKAVIDYTSEIEFSDGSNVRAYLNRAFCFAKMHKFQDAIKDYEKVLEVDPTNQTAMHNIGISCDKAIDN
jgi:tetratricopeptide (TPR) repeat protein